MRVLSLNFFGRNIILGNPSVVDIVIFDEWNSQYVRQVLNPNYSVGVFKMRPFEILIAPSIIMNTILSINHFSLNEALSHPRGFVIGVLFQFRNIYFEGCLVSMKPKAVATMIDNSPVFHWLSRHSRKFPYIAIQNGSRLRYAISENQNFYLQHYFCWGTHESKLYDELGYEVENYYPVGSLLASLYFDHKNDTPISIKYDLLIVSSWRGNIGHSIDVMDTMRSMKIMDELLSEYIKCRPITAAIILRAERNSVHWNIPGIGTEYDYYKSLYGDSIEIIDADFTARTIYPAMQQSRLIVSCLSSSLNEAYGIGKKIVFFNYTEKNKYHCDIDPNCIIEDQNYSGVWARIDDLLSQSETTYWQIHSDNIKKVMAYPDGDTTYNVTLSKIDDIVNSKTF
jgi:surface carbohydrate biosynthesis protein